MTNIRKLTYKFILLGVALIFSIGVKAQIGIDLTEMVNAPDSGYMIITTGDEYPERGLQKYVKFDNVIGIDTVFRKADSVCFRIPSVPKDLCFFLPDSSTQTLTLLRDGDTIRISISDGNTVAFRDSTRSNQDIAQVARDSLGTLDTHNSKNRPRKNFPG